MTIELKNLKYSSEEAWANITKLNKHSKWIAAKKSKDWLSSVKRRLRNPYMLVSADPTFKISREDKIFCIGSCFARNIESHLVNYGLDVLSANIHRDENSDFVPDFLNSYNTKSMFQELSWAINPDSEFPEDALIGGEGRGYFDPHTALIPYKETKEETLSIRRSIIDTTKQVSECRIIIITLGLVEVWYDNLTNLFLNQTPPYRETLRDKDRFSFFVLDYISNFQALDSIYELLHKHGHPDFHIVLSVSPVPIANTFRRDDIVTANTYSKSTLRSVAGDFVNRYENVDYFPSYESVMFSDREQSWQEDCLHVTSDVVNVNILNFIVSYLDDEDLTAHARQALDQFVEPSGISAIGDHIPPDFETAEPGSDGYPAGIPSVTASSLSGELGPSRLVEGSARAWHAQKNPQFPEWLELNYPRPLRCDELWLQAQDNQPERAPTAFILWASDDGDDWVTLLEATDVQWECGGEWSKWSFETDRAWSKYRLDFLGISHGEFLTVQRVWLAPVRTDQADINRAERNESMFA